MPNFHVHSALEQQQQQDDQQQQNRYRILADHILSKARPGLNQLRRLGEDATSSGSSNSDSDNETGGGRVEAANSNGQLNGNHDDDDDDGNENMDNYNEARSFIRLKNGYSVDANNVTSNNE